jgi:hypothetical protein
MEMVEFCDSRVVAVAEHEGLSKSPEVTIIIVRPVVLVLL